MATPTAPRFGRYEIRGILGRGGFAEVYRAWDSALGREVAVKTLLPHLTSDQEMRQRFIQEARAVARLRHSHIVTIHDVGEADGRPFFAMELIEGQTIAAMLAATGPPDTATTAAILRGMAPAIDYLHDAGLIHRDIKAANVMVDRTGRAVLMDFGIARARDQTALTSAGALIGSPETMAPEQVLGKLISPATDIYALGVLAYQLFAGRPPFVGDTGYVLHAHGYEAPPPLRSFHPGVPESTGRAVDSALAKDPAHRPASAGAFIEMLFGTSSAESPPSTPPAITPATMLFAPARALSRPSRSPQMLLAAILGVLAVAGVGGGLLLTRGNTSGTTPLADQSRTTAAVQTQRTATVVAVPTVGTDATTTPAPRDSVASGVVVYDQVLDPSRQQEDEFRITGDSVTACFELALGGASKLIVVVATDRDTSPFAPNDPNVIARSNEVPRKAGPACVPVRIQTAELAAPARYWVWVLEDNVVVGRGGFRTLPAATPTPAPVPPSAPAYTATPLTSDVLSVNQYARIAADQSCLLLRSLPSNNPQTPIFDCLDPGGHVLLLEGPRTAEGEVWWRVRSWNGGNGTPVGWAKGRFLFVSPECNSRRDAASCNTGYAVTPPLVGDWEITDYLRYGPESGKSFSFRISFTQNGTQVTGTGSGLSISGSLDGRTLRATYRQGNTTGSFVWTVTRDGSRLEGAFTNSIGNGGNSYGRRLNGAVISVDQATIVVIGPNGFNSQVRLGSTFYVCFTVSRRSDVTITSSVSNESIEGYNNTLDDGTGDCAGPYRAERAGPRTFTIEMRVNGMPVHRSATTITVVP